MIYFFYSEELICTIKVNKIVSLAGYCGEGRFEKVWV